MTEPSLIVASLLVFYLALVVPLLGPRRYQRFLQRVASNPALRVRLYSLMLVAQCFLVIIVAVVILLSAVPLSTIGLRIPNYGWLQALDAPPITSWLFTLFLLVMLGLLLFVGAIVGERRLQRPQQIGTLNQLLRLKEFLPHTALERRLWLGVSIGAGVSEEITYRGFLTWYILQIGNIFGLQLSFLLALALSTIIFSLAHSYQGWRGIVITVLLGYIFAFFYAVTDSLLLSMVFHILIDARIALLSPAILRLLSQIE